MVKINRASNSQDLFTRKMGWKNNFTVHSVDGLILQLSREHPSTKQMNAIAGYLSVTLYNPLLRWKVKTLVRPNVT